MSKKKLPNVIRVEWVDSYGGGNWIHKDDLDHKPSNIITVGFVVKETKKHITITSSISDGDGEQYLNPITIPKIAIISTEVAVK